MNPAHFSPHTRRRSCWNVLSTLCRCALLFVLVGGVASCSTLKITTTSCPGGTQGRAYAGCTIQASGGSPPYRFLVEATNHSSPLPEGMSLDAYTGRIRSSLIGGQGTYQPEIVVIDSTGAQTFVDISIAINGNNAYLASIFPSTSIFHHRVDAATTGLPVDTSPAAPIFGIYQPLVIRPMFGSGSWHGMPIGIPAIEVPYNQPQVPVSTRKFQSYFSSGPIPPYAPVEGAVTTAGDRHVLVYRKAGGGKPAALYEMWLAVYNDGSWTDGSNALWSDVSSNALTPQGKGTSDAAGLPIAPLLVTADEVIGAGTPSAPKGAIRHPMRFTVNHMLAYRVWPATASAGVRVCWRPDGKVIPSGLEISQSSPPDHCNMSGPSGEIYRLKASVPDPPCAARSPQSAIIITAMRDYGIILADNGLTGGLIGTPDARWNDDDLHCLRSLHLADFEPVNVSSLMVNNDSGATSH